MDAAKVTAHITLGGTLPEFIALHGALSEQEIAEYRLIEEQVRATTADNQQVVWIPSDF